MSRDPGPLPPREPAPNELNWMDDALCPGLHDVFFSEDPAHQDTARRLCATCPVIEPCAAWAKRVRPNSGVWAGVLWRSDGRPERTKRKKAS